MIEIPLTQGVVAIIDDKDIDLIGQHKWYAHKRKGSNVYYAQTNIIEKGKRKTLRMHWLIMGVKHVDHINHNGLDNRRKNLRFCNQSQNTANSRKRMGGKTSEFKGVCRKGEKYLAQITVDGIRYCLGYFYSEENAALAYDRKAEKAFGEFAYLNFPHRKDFPTKERKEFGKNLTRKDVDEIKNMITEGCSIKKISETFNVSVQSIYNIRKGETWKCK